jgi:hypothetical protein
MREQRRRQCPQVTNTSSYATLKVKVEVAVPLVSYRDVAAKEELPNTAEVLYIALLLCFYFQ